MTLPRGVTGTIHKFFLAAIAMVAIGVPSVSAKNPIHPDTLKSPRKLYAEATRFSQHLFNGPRYHIYDRTAETHQFLQSRELSKGTIRYDGRDYGPYLMNYDTYQGIVVIQHPENGALIQLDSTRIEKFTIGDSYFDKIAILPGERKAMFQQLYSGGVKLICKRKKHRYQRTVDRNLKMEFVSNDHFYINAGNGYQKITSRKSLYKLFPDRKQEIRAALKAFPNAFRRQTEEKLLAVVKVVDQSKSIR